MREFRVTFGLRSSYGTPFQADTIFGHICWALRYLEGEPALEEFLSAYEASPPLLLSDGFPVLNGLYYLPRPTLPHGKGAFDGLAAELGIGQGDVNAKRKLSAALKSLEKKPFIETSALIEHSDPLDIVSLSRDCFALRVCPRSMAPVDKGGCGCQTWLECPALETGSASKVKCLARYPQISVEATMHNVINRWKMSSEDLFAQEEMFADCEFYFLAKIDDFVMTRARLEACLDYIKGSGYGRDKSTGKGAVTEFRIEEHNSGTVPGANAFINLSSAYVPRKGELKNAYYNIHVKRGKLGGSCASGSNPWKRHVLMLKAGSLVEGNPEKVYGGLVKGVHYQFDKVVQYGYAYPLGVRIGGNDE